MIGNNIKLLITDFDGTLVNTFKANYLAYQRAFKDVGLNLNEEDYKICFGLRFDEFMAQIGINNYDLKLLISANKKKYYPQYFNYLKLNTSLYNFLQSFRASGGYIAIASTARKENLMNVLINFGIEKKFDMILSGEDVINGKPNPEIYNKILDYFQISPQNTLIFEDSEIGFLAAQEVGVNYIKISNLFYEY